MAISNKEHLFLRQLRENPQAEVRLYVDNKLVSGTYAYQIFESIDAMVAEARNESEPTE